MDASPIQRFAPDRIQSAPSPAPSRRANVRMLAGSLPAVGSVNPKQPISSPVAIRGSHCWRCSSDPCRWIAVIASDPCTETNVRSPESPASNSIAAMPYSTALRPAHP